MQVGLAGAVSQNQGLQIGRHTIQWVENMDWCFD